PTRSGEVDVLAVARGEGQVAGAELQRGGEGQARGEPVPLAARRPHRQRHRVAELDHRPGHARPPHQLLLPRLQRRRRRRARHARHQRARAAQLQIRDEPLQRRPLQVAEHLAVVHGGVRAAVQRAVAEERAGDPCERHAVL
ncbi:hypothetical protein O3G_MSEX000478, partial [Manduca sexta]